MGEASGLETYMASAWAHRRRFEMTVGKRHNSVDLLNREDLVGMVVVR